MGIAGLVENAINGSAQRPGDVVKSLSGQTVEVLNTNAGGNYRKNIFCIEAISIYLGRNLFYTSLF